MARQLCYVTAFDFLWTLWAWSRTQRWSFQAPGNILIATAVVWTPKEHTLLLNADPENSKSLSTFSISSPTMSTTGGRKKQG